jgi:hypothetical protein
MNLSEDYRWNVPVITYSFDESFLNYFGQHGVDEVNKAIAIMNAIPPASQMGFGAAGDPNIYINGIPAPTQSKGFNFQAQALNILDVKSTTLSVLLNELAVLGPERWVWCLRARTVLPGGSPTNYTVIQRNFDPITWNYSPFVNGTLYTYHIIDLTPVVADAIEDLVDPLSSASATVASGALGSIGFLNVGDYYNGLTRDDYGCLRYLYRKNNFHVEPLLPLTTGSSGGPWSIPGSTTNALTNFVNLAIRPGIDKVSFQYVAFDSLVGTTLANTNYLWVDTYVTNGAVKTQNLQRQVTRPEILFTAQDIGVIFGQPLTFAYTYVSVLPAAGAGAAVGGFVNETGFQSQNGVTRPTGGPGIVVPQTQFTFSKVGPVIINTSPSFLNQTNGAPNFVWGSFDGSGTPPFIYPQGSTIEALESQVLSGR